MIVLLLLPSPIASYLEVSYTLLLVGAGARVVCVRAVSLRFAFLK
jgi:hypothetical protein